MKKFVFALLVVLLLLPAAPAFAQDTAFTIRLTRDFGYGGLNGDIEGLFGIHADGPENLQRVDFYIDDQLIASVDASPFRCQFSTKTYSPGTHTLYAIGFTSNGNELRSNELVRVFISPEEARGAIVGLLFPILGIAAVALLAGVLVPLALGRSKPQPGKYGISGGAVCPKCGLPFPIHFFSMHAGAKNLERCPHCGKWVWVRKAKKEDLLAAEARWTGGEAAPDPNAEEDRLKRQIDDSRYEK